MKFAPSAGSVPRDIFSGNASYSFQVTVFDMLYFRKFFDQFTPMTTSTQLRVFICHAKEDKAAALELHKRLHDENINAWIDEENLLPGEEWKIIIEKAVKSSHVVLVLLSRYSITKAGYIQKEIKIALDLADEQPEDTIFIIPIKLEECDVPARLRQFQWLEYYNPKSYELLRKSLLARAESAGILIHSKAKTPDTVLVLVKEDEDALAELYRFPTDSGPYALLSKDNLLFVANWHGGNIAILDPKTKSVVDTIDLDSYEFFDHSDNSKKEIRRYLPGSSMATVKNKLFIGQVFSDFILVIDIDTKLIVKRIYVPGGGEGSFSSSPQEDKVYFASNKTNMFFIIDSTTYEYQTISYPRGGRGCLTILAHPNNKIIYLGIQRGGTQGGKSYFGGNSFLAIYDIEARNYISEIYLAEVINGVSDDSTPHRLILDTDKPILYVGMFQSRKGIYFIDTNENIIKGNITFKPNTSNKYFPWVNPNAQTLYKKYLLTINQSNYEMVAIDRETRQPTLSIFLGEASNGPSDIVVIGDTAIITYPEKNGLIYIDLKKAITSQ